MCIPDWQTKPFGIVVVEEVVGARVVETWQYMHCVVVALVVAALVVAARVVGATVTGEHHQQ